MKRTMRIIDARHRRIFAATLAVTGIVSMPMPAYAADDGDRRCSTWAKDIVRGDTEACSDLCPQAKQFDAYDYRTGLETAFQSRTALGDFLAYLDRSSILGSGAEAQACTVRALLVHWGDEAFAASLAAQTAKAKNQAIGLLDHTAIDAFATRFPKTYALAPHD